MIGLSEFSVIVKRCPPSRSSNRVVAPDGQAINIGTDRETSVAEFAKLMIELFGPTASKIKFVSQEEIYGSSYEDIPRRVPDNTKMRTLLGVTPKIGLREGTKLAMDWFREQAQP